MAAGKPRVGFVFSSKDRPEFTLRSLRSIDTESGFDLIWVDGSETPEAQALPHSVVLRNCNLVEVHSGVTGGPDSAIQFGLRRALDLGYDFCGLIENDVEFTRGWFKPLMELFDLTRRDGFTAGAATVRNVHSRVLEYRTGYTLNWNVGAGMMLFTREAAESILADYPHTTSWEVYEFFRTFLGFDLRDVWELWQDRPTRSLGCDWHFPISVYKIGHVCVGTIPSLARNIDCDFELAVQSHWVTEVPSKALPSRLTPQSLRRGDCPICDAPSSRLWSERSWRLPFSQDRLGLAQCPACGTIFCTPRPSPEQLERFYVDHYRYKWFEDHAWLKRVQGWHRWHRLGPILRDLGLHRGRLLDIGCGHGFFLASAQRSGWEVLGIDYPSRATAHAREVLGLPIIEMDSLDALREGCQEIGSFDLVSLWHCLEHAADPGPLLEQAGRLLNDSGRLLVAVPNASCVGMRRRREDWVWCQEPFVHTVHFTPQSLRMLAERIGLRVVGTWSRDTWDANRLFDLHMGSEVRRITWRVSRISGKVSFLLEEGARLGCYAGGAFRHWCLGQEDPPDVGSELLLLAARKAG